MDIPKSPLAPTSFPTLPEIIGVRLATGNSGIRYKGRPDVLLVECTDGTQVAGVYTTSLTASAPVELCRTHQKNGMGRALIVNAGNSNAFTGKAGELAMQRVVECVSQTLNIPYTECFMGSTGVIGQVLPDAPIRALIPELQAQLQSAGWMDAARAIMTTDTFPKLATTQLELGGKRVTINGIAKGSGMIAPDMATMLAFFFTDAAVDAPILQEIFARCNAKSFNCTTVDGDTSTSDTAMIFATGQAGNVVLQKDSTEALAFESALLHIMQKLAKQVVMDGEGATKFVTIKVIGAEHDTAARNIAMSIANSPLVKTAIAGEDANWGRVVMAVGKAGEKANRDKLTITFGDQLAAKDGQLNPDYNDAQATEHLKGSYIMLAVDVGIANGCAEVWTCDLTHGYIDINGSYRT
jgi:glutamate N-acetyltransferase/amino-acid N-acetyltransferase